jgi:hypothetical protein
MYPGLSAGTTQIAKLAARAGLFTIFLCSIALSKNDTAEIDRSIALRCKNFIGYTTGSNFFSGISYRRSYTKLVSLQFTIGIAYEQGDTAWYNRKPSDTMTYFLSAAPGLEATAIINIATLSNTRLFGYLAAGSISSPEVGLGLDFAFWRFYFSGMIGAPPLNHDKGASLQINTTVFWGF